MTNRFEVGGYESGFGFRWQVWDTKHNCRASRDFESREDAHRRAELLRRDVAGVCLLPARRLRWKVLP